MKTFFLFFLVLLFVSCKIENIEVVKEADYFLSLKNGVLSYADNPLTGATVSYFSDGSLKSKIQYHKGRKQGYEKHWFQDGNLSIIRFYNNGKKKGIHKAWWENRKLKFEYHFNEVGMYNGIVKEWYPSGNMLKFFNYKNGKQAGKQKMWADDGTIRANYEVVNGERFGLIGLKKCYQVNVGETTVK